jgi:hypothetical protein
MLNFSTVPRGDWADKPLYIVGGGPSLRGFDFSRLIGRGRILGVNKAPFNIPCDAMFTLDQTFTRLMREEICAFVQSGGDATLAMPPNEDGHKPIDGARYVVRRRGSGLSEDDREIFGLNSGYGALGLGYLRGAKEIALLGFDFDYDKDGNTHWHDGYTWHSRQNHKYLARWTREFDRPARQLKEAGVNVINFIGPRGSGVREFPTATLNDL